MIGWNDLQRLYLNVTAPDGASINFSWQRCKRAFLKIVGKKCACCGSKKKVEVHHKLPRHIRPDLAVNHKNLIALCGGGKGCHFHIGHLNSYHTYNETVQNCCEYVMKHSILMKNET